ncbi:MAG TPA: zinc-ribbon and DUF3426 domain-containing protein [Steroidobacteraceae bacterium]|nr:zinc-ribbon and DUF3426 domain-containing protein [Steroidobacteraceae bacterium]
MLTECPNCQTVFRVTGAILKLGHGQVRCGKCRTQFDALESLIDEEEFNKTHQGEQAAEEDSGIEARLPDREEEITLEGSRIEISGTYRTLAATDDEPAQIVHEHVVIDREPEFEEEEGDSEIDVSDDELAEETDRQLTSDEEIRADARTDDGGSDTFGSGDFRADYAADQVAPLSQRIWKRAQVKNQANTEHREIAAELAALSVPDYEEPSNKGMWLGLSLSMVLVFAAQLVHHYRDPLVRSPRWGDTISRAYRMLGISLNPNWDLKAYELQVWDVTLGTERDTLRVRASVTNTAAFAQPFPLIKLSLEDRWGGAVGLRAFKPEEYLPTASDRMMAPRQRANAEILLVDPGADAVGFQSHPCLPLSSSLNASAAPQEGAEISIVCSDDSPFVR